MVPLADLQERATAWLEKDPDAETRSQLQEILRENDHEALEQAFSQRMSFGTAGLRGLMGVGPNNMNRLVIRETTAGLANFLHKAQLERGARQRVVIAYDGRHGSYEFAQDAAGVLAANDISVLLYDTVAPTPLCGFAVRKLGTAAGIVVTASHNPPAYNGYKVYRSGGTQINDPLDGQIADEIVAVAGMPSPPDCMPIDLAKRLGRLQYLGEDMFQSYIETISSSLPPFRFTSEEDDTAEARSRFGISYTPLHGVGAHIAEQLLDRRGFKSVYTVLEQREPDGDFPTVNFPNPEEPGATDLVMSLADQHDAPLAIANDPDADRLCICVRDNSGKMKQMTGDQLGSLLGDAMITRAQAQAKEGQAVAVRSTIVSSRILAKIAQLRGAEHRETLTGFKWLGPSAFRAVENGKRFAFAYEEALGYMVTDDVLDKDGLSALLVIAELAFALHLQGKTLWDRLEDIHRQVGLSITMQRTIKLKPGMSGDAIMRRLRMEHRSHVGPFKIALTDDLLQRPANSRALGEEVPKNDVLRYYIATKGVASLSREEIMLTQPRIIVRPSGTEPKVKIYCEMLGSINEGETYQHGSQRVTAELTAIVDAFHAWMSDSETTSSVEKKEPIASSSFPMSSFIRQLFTSFPLRTYSAPIVFSPTPQGRSKKPVLYVAPPHPNSKYNWASRDPRCLYWQLLLTFRGVDFDCVHVDGYGDANSGLGQLPCLQNINTTIVTTKELPLWIKRVAPVDARVGSGSISEEKGVESLLKGPFIAGVLLAILNLPNISTTTPSTPLLSRLLQDSLEYQDRRKLAGFVSTLTEASPISRLPGWSTSFYGLLGGNGALTGVGTGGDEKEEEQDASIDVADLNQAKILRDAVDSIQALSILLEESSNRWLTGASIPSHLDALLFALLHTALSLPSDACPDLRDCIEACPNLRDWTKQVWQTHVRPRGG
ncbi:hypothetical protein CBS101457_005682 [Exobasidium rhododendri]|nr:hypothetical protein CBS101457_005682 [Exobasidium rhododendri]